MRRSSPPKGRKLLPLLLANATLFVASACSEGAEFQGDLPKLQVNTSENGSKLPLPKPVPLPVETTTPPVTLSLISSFSASQIKQENFRFELNAKEVQTEFTLANVYEKNTEAKQQVTRSLNSETFRQGTAGQDKVESIANPAAKGLVDILLVIDNSGSMSEEQTNLGTKLSALLESIKDTSWQIGVITTTVSSTCEMTLIKSTDDPAIARSTFLAAVNAGISGSGDERGIRQARVGLDCRDGNGQRKLVRNDSSVAVLIVSDEDNCSFGTCSNIYSPAEWDSHENLIAFVEGASTLNRKVGTKAGFYGIFAPPGEVCRSAPSPANIYKRLVTYNSATTNYGNICNADYTPVLNQISGNIALLVTKQFQLGEEPSPGTLTLKIASSGTVIPTASYSLQGRTVTFAEGAAPLSGITIEARYKVGVRPKFNHITLSKDPAPDTLSVHVNGNALSPDAYTVAGRKLTFTTEPVDSAEIGIDFRVGAPLPNSFEIAQNPHDAAKNLVVMLNGQQLDASAYTIDNAAKKVILNKAPADGSLVSFMYPYRAGSQLEYPIALMNGAQNFKLFDGPKEIGFTKQNDVFKINGADHAEGKKLKLKYEIPNSDLKAFKLSHLPIGDSVTIESDSNCDAATNIRVEGSDLLVRCNIDKLSVFSIRYDYTEVRKSFEVPQTKVIDKKSLQVLVNGLATNDYTLTGNTVTLNFEPDLASKVVLIYTPAEQ